jgi:hypothetical protein
MRRLAATSHYSHRVQFGRYVVRRLRRARMTTMADSLEHATTAVRDAGRAWEDAEDAIQDALADRDAYDDDLDTVAQTARAHLGGRSADATRRPPYTQVFPDGVTYYTAAPLAEEEKRYGELRMRVEEHLPADDPARVQTVPGLDAGLAGFRQATTDLNTRRAAESLAATRLTTATETWERELDRAYGLLVAEMGRQRAERFFPKNRGSKAETPEKPEPEKPELEKPVPGKD